MFSLLVTLSSNLKNYSNRRNGPLEVEKNLAETLAMRLSKILYGMAIDWIS